MASVFLFLACLSHVTFMGAGISPVLFTKVFPVSIIMPGIGRYFINMCWINAVNQGRLPEGGTLYIYRWKGNGNWSTEKIGHILGVGGWCRAGAQKICVSKYLGESGRWHGLSTSKYGIWVRTCSFVLIPLLILGTWDRSKKAPLWDQEGCAENWSLSAA